MAGVLTGIMLARPVSLFITASFGWAASALAILIDAAAHANQVVSQRVLFSGAPETRGRINAIIMTVTFAGGAVGSVLGTVTYHWGRLEYDSGTRWIDRRADALAIRHRDAPLALINNATGCFWALGLALDGVCSLVASSSSALLTGFG